MCIFFINLNIIIYNYENFIFNFKNLFMLKEKNLRAKNLNLNLGEILWKL